MNLEQFLVALAKHLRTSPTQIDKIIRSAPFRYKHYTIPKRSGGLRDIYHPSAALKSIQRWIVKFPLSNLPVHDSVYSYVVDKNIGMNAQAHTESNYFLRFDFENFFPSISHSVLKSFLLRKIDDNTIPLAHDLVGALVRLVCRADKVDGDLALSIGAPSSPFLSNAVLFEFDSLINELVVNKGGIYTRYADDVYISARDSSLMLDLENNFRTLVTSHLPFTKINEGKVHRLSRKRRVTITGVNVTSDRKVSVGRDLKRSIRSRLYLVLNEKGSSIDYSSLRGSIAYVMSIEPNFIERLRQKFGNQTVDDFMGFSSKN